MKKEGFLRGHWRGRPYLLSPLMDFFCAGGAALLFVLVLVVFVPYRKENIDDVYLVGTLTGIFYWLAFAVNYPHFMVSYQLLYAGFRGRSKSLKEHPAMWWRLMNAGLIVPLALVAMMVFIAKAAMSGDLSWMAIGLHAMFFFVGWHYTKQAFGTFIMLSALKKLYYTARQRKILLVNAYTVWLCSWAYLSYSSRVLGESFQQGFTGSSAYSKYGFAYADVPDAVRIPLLLITLATTLASVWVILGQWKKTGHHPSLTGLTCYGSMYYLWAFVAVLHPEWVLFAPFFHSLQYLLFVIAYKRGEMHVRLKKQGMADEVTEARAQEKLRKKLRNRAQEYFAWAFLLGVLMFVLIPSRIDIFYAGEGISLPANFFVLLFAIFINVHHYFIDNVIWRKENKQVGQYLLHWRE